jgi:hypothetical protein
MTCDESSGGVGIKRGKSTLRLPTIETLPLPASSDHCMVASNAQLQGSGNLTISLWNGSAPLVTFGPPGGREHT